MPEGMPGDVVRPELCLVVVMMKQRLKQPEGFQGYLLRCHDVSHVANETVTRARLQSYFWPSVHMKFHVF